MMYNYGTGNNYSYGGYASGYGYGGYAPVAYPMPVYSTGSGCSNNFALILVLFILLVIIGCSHGFGGGNNSGFGGYC